MPFTAKDQKQLKLLGPSVQPTSKLKGAIRRAKSRPQTTKGKKGALVQKKAGMKVSNGVSILANITLSVNATTVMPRAINNPISVLPRSDSQPAQLAVEVDWSVARSLFSNCQWATEKSYAKSFESDWELANISKFVKAPDDCASIKETMKRHYGILVAIFKYYSTTYELAKLFVAMETAAFRRFLEACNISNKEFFKPALADTIFIASNYMVTAGVEFPERNYDTALIRFEFINAIVRVAVARFKTPGHRSISCDSYPPTEKSESPNAAVLKLLSDFILPHAIWEDPNFFRNHWLVYEDVDMLFRAYLVKVVKVFSSFVLLLDNVCALF
jgi:hypothetical protein